MVEGDDLIDIPDSLNVSENLRMMLDFVCLNMILSISNHIEEVVLTKGYLNLKFSHLNEIFFDK
jgi:hypothetical protein